MNLTRDRLHTIGWGTALAICFALTLALTFKVNAVKSEVHLANRQIAHLQQEKMFLETEFEARANQQQLKALNDTDFGYEAPTAGQYLESERQLAMLGKPAAPDAPKPVRMAENDAVGLPSGLPAGMPAMVSPMTGKPMDAPAKADHAGRKSSLSQRLSRLDDVVARAVPSAGARRE
jgi:hypothetical protein